MSDKKETHVGQTAVSFKLRLANHQCDERHSTGRKNTTLAGHIWKLKDQGIEPEVSWKILTKSPSYKPGDR